MEASEYLIQNGSSIHEKDKFGRNGIMIAIERGHNHMIDELIKLKINIHDKNNDGRTALFSAVINGNKNVIKKIINQGGDIKDKDKDGNTLLHIICHHGRSDTPEDHNKIDIIKLIIHLYSNLLTERDIYHRTPLTIAAMEGNEYMIDKLLRLHRITLFDAAETFQYLKSTPDWIRNRSGKILCEYGVPIHKDDLKYFDGETFKLSLQYNNEQFKNQNYIQFFNTLEPSALLSYAFSGNSDAQYVYAIYLLNKNSIKDSLYFLHRSAFQHQPDSLYELGKYYLNTDLYIQQIQSQFNLSNQLNSSSPSSNASSSASQSHSHVLSRFFHRALSTPSLPPHHPNSSSPSPSPSPNPIQSPSSPSPLNHSSTISYSSAPFSSPTASTSAPSNANSRIKSIHDKEQLNTSDNSIQRLRQSSVDSSHGPNIPTVASRFAKKSQLSTTNPKLLTSFVAKQNEQKRSAKSNDSEKDIQIIEIDCNEELEKEEEEEFIRSIPILLLDQNLHCYRQEQRLKQYYSYLKKEKIKKKQGKHKNSKVERRIKLGKKLLKLSVHLANHYKSSVLLSNYYIKDNNLKKAIKYLEIADHLQQSNNEEIKLLLSNTSLQLGLYYLYYKKNYRSAKFYLQISHNLKNKLAFLPLRRANFYFKLYRFYQPDLISSSSSLLTNSNSLTCSTEAILHPGSGLAMELNAKRNKKKEEKERMMRELYNDHYLAHCVFTYSQISNFIINKISVVSSWENLLSLFIKWNLDHFRNHDDSTFCINSDVIKWLIHLRYSTPLPSLSFLPLSSILLYNLSHTLLSSFPPSPFYFLFVSSVSIFSDYSLPLLPLICLCFLSIYFFHFIAFIILLEGHPSMSTSPFISLTMLMVPFLLSSSLFPSPEYPEGFITKSAFLSLLRILF